MSVKVAVRVRPFNQRQKFLGCLNCIQMKQKTTILINPRDRAQKEHQFTFDYSFWSHDGFEELENGYLYPIDDRFVDQKRIFKELGEEILRNAWNGFNCCLFAYGQTGAGKSYSMIGYETNRGIVPMACEKIFQGIQRNKIKGKKEFQLTLSMLEIYNEKVQDLFVHTSKRPVNGLRIRQSKKVGVYVEGITRYQVHSYAQIERRMQQGAKNRSLASTLMNEYSSRAHTIVIIEFIQKEFITEQKMNKKTSMLNLVDLAGSERVAKTGISDKDRLKEASQINKSLHTLGRVIEHLAELAADKGKVVQIPYRESALTRILETALGGNSVTTMICAVSPANDNYEETLSTLRYADQTKKIKNKPIINESAVDKIIRELRQQNERLKQMLRIAKLKGINLQQGQNGNIFANIQQIQREIRKNMQSFAINTDGLQDDDDSSSIMISEFIDVPDPNDFYSGQLSFDNNSTTTIGNARANAFITNLSEDRLLSFKIKYSCEEELYVGNKNLKEGGRNKLVLCGLGIEDRHARLYEINGKYFIEALSDQAGEYTLVNGRPVEKRMELRHNDRIIFGTNSVFLFKNFNQKGVKSPEKKGVGTGSQNVSKSGIKTGTGVGIGTGTGISIGTDDLNQSLLIDWQQDEKPKPKPQTKPIAHSLSIETDPYDEQLDQKLLDYEFAINERQNKLFDTSLSSSGLTSSSSSTLTLNKLQSAAGKHEMASKLEEIQKQFQALKKQNQRKMKEREEEFRLQLKQMQIQKQIQKAKLKEELKIKEVQAKRINTEKDRIQKIRDKLLEIQRDRKEKTKKLKESMLLGDDEEDGEKIEFQEVPSPTHQIGNHNKKKGMVSIGQTQIMPTQVQTTSPIQPKIEYIDQHHFHYDFNVIHNESPQTTPIPSKTVQQTKYDANTTSATNMNVHHDQSLLLDSSGELKKKEVHFEKVQGQGEQGEAKGKKVRKQLKMETVFNLNQMPAVQPQPVVVDDHSAEEKEQKKQRRRSLNMTDILYDTGSSTRPRKNSKNSHKGSDHHDSQQNLLNMTDDACILVSYIPPQPSDNISNKREGYENISLNLSDDMSLHHAMREEELLDKIREYEEKLRNLEQSAQEKKESIRNIRKSFVVEFGESPSSENFYSEEKLFQGELDFSMIQTRKNSSDIAQNSELQKKIKDNMIQCQNENIINQRSLQVRKRKRQAEQLKEAFIKKQKKELQKQLVQLIPMLQKFNLWARQMNRNLQGKIEIEYHNFTNYQIIDALKSTMKGKIGIHIKIYNFQQGRTYKWAVEVFRNRFEIAENLFERFLENPTSEMFVDKSKDPFWDPRDFLPYAVGYLSLEPLSYALDFEGEVSLVYKGQIIGYLDIILEPAIDRKAMKLRDKITQQSQSENQIYDPRQLLEQDLCFTLSIQKFRPTEHLPSQKIQKYFISYDLLEDSYQTQTYKTQQLSIGKKQIGYMLKHSLHNVTEHTLAYLADSPICLTLNLLFHYDEEMSNMTSSFIQNQSSLNMSSISEKLSKSELKSQVGSSESPPSFAKKKTAIIIENPDILPKIEKEFTTEQKRIRQRAETINPNAGSGSGSNKKKEKDKDKNKQQCSIF